MIAGRPEPQVKFDVNQRRWNVSAFWPRQPLLVRQDLPSELTLLRDQVASVKDTVRIDLGRRDRRLVRQASYVIVWNPLYRMNTDKEPSVEKDLNQGVEAEIRTAVANHIPLIIYQDPKHCPLDLLRRHLGIAVSSLGESADAHWYQFLDDEDDFFNSIEQAIRKY